MHFNVEQDAYAEFANLTVGPRYPDTFWNLNVLNVAQSPFGGTTRVRVSRPFVSPDFKQDVDIPYVSCNISMKWDHI